MNKRMHRVVEEVDSNSPRLTDEVPSTFELPGGFTITGPESANRLVRKVNAARKYSTRVRAWANQELIRARKEEQLLERFGGQLAAWLREYLIETGADRRSINLPAGAVGFRAQPPRPHVVDDEALLDWCRKHLVEAVHVHIESSGSLAVEWESLCRQRPDETRVVVATSKSTINDYFASSGEIPDGTTLVDGTDRVSIL